MTDALFRVALADGRPCLALGEVTEGPQRLLAAEQTLDILLASDAEPFWPTVESAARMSVPDGIRVLAPIGSQEVWAAGVTYAPSRDARKTESPQHGSVYEAVFRAQRPELFYKCRGSRARGPAEDICIRSDSSWNVPEPELVLVISSAGEIVALTIGNDASSRSIEGANPLYLPQAKIYDGSCAIGPCLVPPPANLDLDISLEIRRLGEPIFQATTNTSSIDRSFEELVGWLRRALSFPVGAFLLTGTGIIPPAEFSLREGDTVAISIEGFGSLVNTVRLLECGQPPSDEPAPSVLA